MQDIFNSDDINSLINGAFKSTVLREKFEARLFQLGISFNQGVENLQIEYRTLNGILDGTLERIDFLSLLKIAQFIDVPYNDITDLYVQAISHRHKDDLALSQKRTFILNNFDLPVLKSEGIIDSIRDFAHIETRLKEILGLESILDYNTDYPKPAFSSARAIKDDRTRKYFIRKAQTVFELISNPNQYSQDALIYYIPKIRRNSIDKEQGLLNVIRALYKLGVTVVFQPKMASLALRGATFSVNDKPCIVLTDHRNSYPTMWFALMHELFHVIFDWEEIKLKKYHLSDLKDDIEVIRERENEADEFARDYMFPKTELEIIGERMLSDKLLVRERAMEYLVHPSIIYANYAYANNTEEKKLWKELNKMRVMPPIRDLLKKLSNDLDTTSKALDYASYYRLSIFNND